MSLLINKKALAQTTSLAGDDVILVLQENMNQKNAGNKGITVDNFVTAIESRIDDVVGNLDITGNLTVTGTSTFAGAITGADYFQFTKEVNHTITVAASTTAATAGGNISVKAGSGSTSGAGGNATISSGDAGNTAGATSGNLTITSGNEGSGTGLTGSININTANATGGAAGNINVNPGTTSSTTVSAKTEISKGIVRKPLSSSVASGGTITGKQLVDGLITCTGATGNWQLPTAAQITTAIGSTPAGTQFEFTVNAAGMTATNVCTLLVGANISVPATPIVTGSGTLTVSQSAQVVGVFRIVYDTPTSCKLFRVS
jgi:hypothetical protein